MSGFMDRIAGRMKKAAGDLAGNANLRREGARDERKADAKDDLARAQQEADLKAREVANLERQGNAESPNRSAGSGPGSGTTQP
jgi:uncharacterized protein YjbJ (UPF0337 family)